MVEDLDDLLDAAQPNPLLRAIDALCERRAWDDLVTMASRCRQAVERGKQLWPIAEHIEYRLALEAPGEIAGPFVTVEAGRFAHGPLTEVAASTHTFDELVGHLTSDLVAGVVAQERIMRGEDLRRRPEAQPDVFELPMVAMPWEPGYPTAVYRSNSIEAPPPDLSVSLETSAGQGGEAVEDEELERALMDLVSPWVSGSNGDVSVALVESDVASAVEALGLSPRLGRISRAQAFGQMGWAAANGGAHGRRRGMAFGRFSAWAVAASIAGLGWPCDPEQIDEELTLVSWSVFACGRTGGWHLDLAFEHEEEGWAAAITAHDS